MIKIGGVTLAALAVLLAVSPHLGAQGSTGAETIGVITSSSAYDQTNPDGSVTKMLMMVIKKADGSSVIKTEVLPTATGRDSHGRLVTGYTVPNSKMAVVSSAVPKSESPRTIDELIAQRGRPLSIAEGPRKAIYRWSDLEVTVVGGVITQSFERDTDAERNHEAERAYRADVERQRLFQERQAQMAAIASAPSPAYSSASTGYTPPTGPSREERIAEIHLEIEQCRRTIDLHFKEVSTPFSARRISPAMLELAEAQLARLEHELIDLQAP